MSCTISLSLLATVCFTRDEDGIGWSKFLLEFALKCWMSIRLLRPSLFIKGSLHLVRDPAAEEELDIAI